PEIWQGYNSPVGFDSAERIIGDFGVLGAGQSIEDRAFTNVG
ncbi:unnamed protein product, partial [marine sediment metagenome]